MRVLGVALGLVVACAVAGCSGSGSGSGSASAAAEIHPNTAAACSLLKRLDATGDIVKHANVKDPAAFDAAMQRAVRKYTDTLDELHRVAPRNLIGNVERLRAAVDQYRFADGVDDHAALTDFAQRQCR